MYQLTRFPLLVIASLVLVLSRAPAKRAALDTLRDVDGILRRRASKWAGCSNARSYFEKYL